MRRRRSTLLFGGLGVALLLSQGVALAATIQCPPIETGYCVGTSGNDTMIDTSGTEVMTGRAGNDLMVGKEDNDVMDGQEGDDVLNGGPGPDDLKGGVGNDRLSGKEDDDFLKGQEGDDLLNGGTGADWYSFGRNSGRDTIVDSRPAGAGFEMDNAVTIYAEDPNRGAFTINLVSDSGPSPEVRDSAGSTIQWAGNVIDVVTICSPRGDTIRGNAAPNQIETSWGADTVFGGGGDDHIDVYDVGDDDDDTVDCGAGIDHVENDPGDHISANCEFTSQ